MHGPYSQEGIVKYTTMNILSQLTKARFALKRKIDDFQQVKNHTNLQLEETLNPLLNPYMNLLRKIKNKRFLM